MGSKRLHRRERAVTPVVALVFMAVVVVFVAAIAAALAFGLF